METSTLNNIETMIEIRHRKTAKGENYKTPSYLRKAVKSMKNII